MSGDGLSDVVSLTISRGGPGRSLHLGSENRMNKVHIWRIANTLASLESGCVGNVYEEWERTVAVGWTPRVVWERGSRRNADQLSKLHHFAKGRLEQMLVDTSCPGYWDRSRKKMGREGRDQSWSRKEATIFPCYPLNLPPAFCGFTGQDWWLKSDHLILPSIPSLVQYIFNPSIPW